MLVFVLASCGTSTTKTVTKVAPVTTTAAPTSTTGSAPTTSTTSTTAPTSTTTAASAASPVYFEGVAGGRAQRPKTLELTGDGTLFVSSVQWDAWGGPTATGTGNAQYHGCTPTCAQATPNSALVSIRLSTVRVCSGRQYYSSVTLTMNSGQLLDKSFLQRSWSPC